MLIRAARASELRAVGELTVGAYVADALIAPDAAYVGELRAADERTNQAELMVAVEGDRLLGTVTFCLAGSPWAEICEAGEAEFRMLAVAPHARGRGVGSALAGWCVDRAREQGSNAVALSSLPDMSTAHRIYERLGFVRTPGRDWRPTDDVELIAYVLDLRAG